MNRVAELIAKEILRAEKNMFIFRLLGVLATYVGITYWLNCVRQSAGLWFVWCLIGCQLFLFVTIFVVCSIRMRQCRVHGWWLWFPLILSRVNDWEMVLIPVTTIIILVLSEKNVHVSQERQHLLPPEEDESGVTPSVEAPDVGVRQRDGGDSTAPANLTRLELALSREKYRKLLYDLIDHIGGKPPLIGDCASLPHPKKVLLYAVRWMMADYEDEGEAATDQVICEKYEAMLPVLGDLFTRVARDWHEIDAEDREAVARLNRCDSFPQWASDLKRKYIDEQKASELALDVAFQVIAERARDTG